jgi:hypothetical protein
VRNNRPFGKADLEGFNLKILDTVGDMKSQRVDVRPKRVKEA